MTFSSGLAIDVGGLRAAMRGSFGKSKNILLDLDLDRLEAVTLGVFVLATQGRGATLAGLCARRGACKPDEVLVKPQDFLGGQLDHSEGLDALDRRGCRLRDRQNPI